MAEAKEAGDDSSSREAGEVFPKNSVAWYHKNPTPIATLDDADQMFIPVLLVKIVGVHYDDFPNVYYTIAVEKPVLFTGGSEADLEQLSFEDEKQTDTAHLIADSTMNRNRVGTSLERRKSTTDDSSNLNDDFARKKTKVRKSSILLAGVDKGILLKQLEEEKAASGISPVKPSDSPGNSKSPKFGERKKPQRKSSITNLFGLLSFNGDKKEKDKPSASTTVTSTVITPSTVTATSDDSSGAIRDEHLDYGRSAVPIVVVKGDSGSDVKTEAPNASPTQPAYSKDRKPSVTSGNTTSPSVGVRRRSMQRVMSVKAAARSSATEEVLKQFQLNDIRGYEEAWEVKATKEKVLEVITMPEEDVNAYEEVWEKKAAAEIAAATKVSTAFTNNKSSSVVKKPQKFVPPPPKKASVVVEEKNQSFSKKVSWSEKPPTVRQISFSSAVPEDGADLNAAADALAAALSLAEDSLTENSPPPPSRKPLDEVELHHAHQAHIDRLHDVEEEGFDTEDVQEESGFDDSDEPDSEPEAELGLGPEESVEEATPAPMVRRLSLRTAPPPPPLPSVV